MTHVLSLSHPAAGAAGEKRMNKLVFIGKHLNKQELEEAFKACLVE